VKVKRNLAAEFEINQPESENTINDSNNAKDSEENEIGKINRYREK